VSRDASQPAPDDAGEIDRFHVVLRGVEHVASLAPSRRAGWTLSDIQRQTRGQLGLPTDRPIAMSGHQAEFWHAGILAKLAATNAFARHCDAHAAWLVVDQDSNSPQQVTYPATARDATLTRRVWTLDATPLADDTPTGARAPLGHEKPITETPNDLADATLRLRLDLIRTLLVRHVKASSAAEQVTLSLRDLLADIHPPLTSLPPHVLATYLSRTTLFARILDRMRDDPLACIHAYNAAARSSPHAGIRPLDESRGELPLWATRFDEPRRRVFASMLSRTPRDELMPRALLMTGLVRAAACDVFIHGLGGGGLSDDDGYDRLTSLWFKHWLTDRDADLSLAPVVTASATLRLSLPGPATPTAEEIAHTVWTAHAATHQPRLVGDHTRQARRDALLASINAARARGESPASAFAALHALLDEHRRANTPALTAAHARADLAQSRVEESKVRHDRTWSVALHDPAALADLCRHVAARCDAAMATR